MRYSRHAGRKRRARRGPKGNQASKTPVGALRARARILLLITNEFSTVCLRAYAPFWW